jgi:transglutaminase-like putative cysteine protease
VIYDLRHLTIYRYESPVTFARCALRLTPRSDSEQRLISTKLTITPRPILLENHQGQFGERVVTAIVETPHRELRIEAASRVDVRHRERTAPLAWTTWEDARDAALAIASLDLDSPAHFLFPTPITPISAEFTAYARQEFVEGRPILEAALALACRIHADFTYDPKATEVWTPSAHAFEARRGVCQDFAHIMISALKGLGLPAAYVSGYLRTRPAPGRPHLQGADATHAWVSLWCGPSEGWVGFDPTNALVVSSEHIVLAVGRDYSDVAPIGGVLLGSGDQKISVAVDVAPVA